MLIVVNTRLLVVTLVVCADINSFSASPRISECKILFHYSGSFCALLLRRVMLVMLSIGDTSVVSVAAVKAGATGLLDSTQRSGR